MNTSGNGRRTNLPPGFFMEPFLPLGASEIEQLRILTRLQEEQLASLVRDEPMLLATITDIREDGEGGRLAVLTFPEGDSEAPLPKKAKGMELGATVRVLRKNRTIVGAVDVKLVGPVAEVVDVLADGLLLVEQGNVRRAVRSCGVTAAPGERVLIDQHGRFALRALGAAPPSP